jgi:type IV pilus assembly protein PilV
MAAHDLADWGAKVKAALPGGTGVVCVDSTPNDGTAPGTATALCDGTGTVGYVIKIWWNDDRTTKSASAVRPLFWTAFNP